MRFERGLTIALIGLAVALPLIFAPALSEAFALPKSVLLQVAALLGAAMFVGYLAVGGAARYQWHLAIDLPVAGFLVLTVAATLASVDRRQSLVGEFDQYQGLATTFAYVGSFYVARLVFVGAGRFRLLLIAIVATGAVISAYGIAQAVGVDPFWDGPPRHDRVISTVGQANAFASYLLIVLVCVVGLWPTAPARQRRLLLITATLAGIALLLTYSRGGYLAFVITLVVVVLVRRRALRVGPSVAMRPLVVAGLAVAVFATAVPGIRDALVRGLDRTTSALDSEEGSNRQHLDLWAIGIRIAIEHPVLGTGPETFPLVVPAYRDRVLPPDRAAILSRFRPESPHNELIGVAAGSGLPALLAYGTFLIACAWEFARRVRRARWGPEADAATVGLGVVTAHFLTTFFMTPEVTSSWLFWVLTGAALAGSATLLTSGNNPSVEAASA